MREKRIDKYKIFKVLVMIYLIVSPIFEVVYLYNHVTTLLRVMCLLIFAIITLVLYKESRKKVLYLLAYYLAMGIYLVISYFHSKGFVSLVPGNFDYSIVSEATTLLKLCMPFTLLFILKFVKFNKKDFFRVINSWIIIVAGSIVLLNVLGLSLSSYADGFTKYSIFSWGKGLSVRDIATRGLFVFANQEVLILLMLLVMSVYEYLFIDKRTIVFTILIALAMMMLGTRIATYGGLLTLIAMTISYIIYSVILKKKINRWFLLLLVVSGWWFLMLPITPCEARVEEIKKASEVIIHKSEKNTKKINQVKTEKVKEDDFETFKKEINKNLVGERFYLDYYPYEYDKDFWNNILEKQKEIKLNYRMLELMIIQRVTKVDGRWTDYIFGISNSRIQNIVNIEQDFVLHFYAYGVLGMLLVLLFYVYSLIKLVRNLFLNKSFIDFSILACLGLFMLSAFLSGNNVNFLAGIIPLAFIVSFGDSRNDKELKYKEKSC